MVRRMGSVRPSQGGWTDTKERVVTGEKRAQRTNEQPHMHDDGTRIPMMRKEDFSHNSMHFPHRREEGACVVRARTLVRRKVHEHARVHKNA